MSVKERIKLWMLRWRQYRCPHNSRRTETWLQHRAVYSRTTCEDCGAGVPSFYTIPDNRSRELLDMAKRLQPNEKKYV